MNKLKYAAVQGSDVIAYLVENPVYGLVAIFLTNKIDVLENIKVYDVENVGEEVNNQNLLDLLWFPFPNVKDPTQESQNPEDLSG